MVFDKVLLLDAADATGGEKRWPGGRAIWTMLGTFAGATATLEYRVEPTDAWTLYPSASMTDVGGMALDLPVCEVRVVLTSGTPVGMRSYLSGTCY